MLCTAQLWLRKSKCQVLTFLIELSALWEWFHLIRNRELWLLKFSKGPALTYRILLCIVFLPMLFYLSWNYVFKVSVVSFEFLKFSDIPIRMNWKPRKCLLNADKDFTYLYANLHLFSVAEKTCSVKEKLYQTKGEQRKIFPQKCNRILMKKMNTL